jgi:hypothetical protein
MAGLHMITTTEVQYIVPDWGDKVDYGIGLSYRPAKLHTTALFHSRLQPQGKYDRAHTVRQAETTTGQSDRQSRSDLIRQAIFAGQLVLDKRMNAWDG